MRALSLLIFVALASSATAAVLDGGGEEPMAEASAVATGGSFGFSNSRDGVAIFSATEITPGGSVSGTVEIANDGGLPGELVVAQHHIEDTPGPGGGALSRRLALRIADVTAPAHPVTIYAGPLAPMPARSAGILEPGASRTYEFTATLPTVGPAGGTQNDVQAASTSVAYSWTAGEVAKSPEPAPPTGPAPSQSPPAPAGAGRAAAPLRLTITRMHHAIRHGRLLVWARCNDACAIVARGRLRARGPAEHRGAKLRLNHRARFTAGRQRLAVRIPLKLRHWLQAAPKPVRARARLSLSARNPAGEHATARRTVRVRLP